MPKQRKFSTPLADLAPELAGRTRGLREQAAAGEPPAPPAHAPEAETQAPEAPTAAPTAPPAGGAEAAGAGRAEGRAAAPRAPRPGASDAGAAPIPRRQGRLLFLEPGHNRAIEQIHWATRADRQDIIRAALDDFLRRHFDGQAVSPQGARLIEEYRRRIHPPRPRRGG